MIIIINNIILNLQLNNQLYFILERETVLNKLTLRGQIKI